MKMETQDLHRQLEMECGLREVSKSALYSKYNILESRPAKLSMCKEECLTSDNFRWLDFDISWYVGRAETRS